jgi:hypothetical protein
MHNSSMLGCGQLKRIKIDFTLWFGLLFTLQ